MATNSLEKSIHTASKDHEILRNEASLPPVNEEAFTMAADTQPNKEIVDGETDITQKSLNDQKHTFVLGDVGKDVASGQEEIPSYAHGSELRKSTCSSRLVQANAPTFDMNEAEFNGLEIDLDVREVMPQSIQSFSNFQSNPNQTPIPLWCQESHYHC